MSFYLKYRPQRVKELDLTDSREALLKVLKSGDFSHAYLFSGPKGTGKTSSARILAKVLNCEKNAAALKKGEPLTEPCNECDQCKAITTGSSLAVIEMDAASNRGIDDIRALRERIGLAPAQGAFSVYVIDEVHMLTTEAFNALLKTLEEPPEHAVFVLATTEPHKLPDTVISRCTRIQFRKATKDEVVRSLTKVVEGEKLKVEAGVLESIAERVDGSFRDGMKILEQLAQEKGKITQEVVDALTGFSDEYDPDTLITALIEKDAQVALKDLSERERQGVDFSVFSKRVVEELRGHLIDTVTKQEAVASPDEWVSLLNLFTDASMQMKTAVISQLPLEIAVVSWCMQGKQAGGSSSKTGGKVQKKRKTNFQDDDAVDLKKTAIVDTEKNGVDQKLKVKSESTPKEDEKPVAKPKNMANGTLDTTKFKKEWPEIIKAVGQENTSLTALLKAAQPLEASNDSVVLSVSYAFHKEQLEQDRHRNILEEIIANVCQARVRLSFELGEKNKNGVSKKAPKAVSNITGSVEDEELAKAAEEIFG